jgi:hypothetical protein
VGDEGDLLVELNQHETPDRSRTGSPFAKLATAVERELAQTATKSPTEEAVIVATA